jgi:hypothetical protein
MVCDDLQVAAAQHVAQLMALLDALERGEGAAFYTQHGLQEPGDSLG